jgi:hypothetical protein
MERSQAVNATLTSSALPPSHSLLRSEWPLLAKTGGKPHSNEVSRPAIMRKTPNDSDGKAGDVIRRQQTANSTRTGRIAAD